MKTTATYTVHRLRCGNCGWRDEPHRQEPEQIPVGRAVKDHPCPRCGCVALTCRTGF